MSDEHDNRERKARDLIDDLKTAAANSETVAKLDELARTLNFSEGPDIHASATPRRRFGAFADKFRIGPAFFEPLAHEDKRLWAED